jgi:uncharacterized membrane protein YkvI
MPETVSGIPLHPLVVHAVVVLLPLAATGVLAMAAVPRLRRVLGFTVLCVTVVAVAMVPVAKLSGENLRDSLREAPLVERHASLGETLLYFALPLLVAATLLWWMGRRNRHDKPTGSVVTIVVGVLSVIVAVTTIVQVVRVGHSGSEAVWSGVLASDS